jgi:hypothetical protein
MRRTAAIASPDGAATIEERRLGDLGMRTLTSGAHSRVHTRRLVGRQVGLDVTVVVLDELRANDTSPNLFSREPAFGCFVAGNFDFMLAPYHATWSEGDIDDISDEVEHVAEVFTAMAAAQSGEPT